MDNPNASILRSDECPYCGGSRPTSVGDEACPACGLKGGTGYRTFACHSLWKQWGNGPKPILVLVVLLFSYADYIALRDELVPLDVMRMSSVVCFVINVLLYMILYWTVVRTPRYCIVAGPEWVALVDRKQRHTVRYPIGELKGAEFESWTGLSLRVDGGKEWLHNCILRESEGRQCAECIDSLVRGIETRT